MGIPIPCRRGGDGSRRGFILQCRRRSDRAFRLLPFRAGRREGTVLRASGGIRARGTADAGKIPPATHRSHLPPMRPVWKGSIQFGLVSIPVNLMPATHREELTFRLLRKKDLSPVNYRRVAEADGKPVEWGDIVKGYEYEKGRFVVLKEEDFQRVDVEATQSVTIQSFVKLEELDPVFFHKPYYLEPDRRGERAYVLLRDALKQTGRIGIARVVIRTREHLAAVKPSGSGLMLELMRFADELVDAKEFKVPAAGSADRKEMRMAVSLIESMSEPWNPADYKDEYRERLEAMIEEKVRSGGKTAPAPARTRRPPNVIDLVSVLQKSLDESTGRTPKRKAPRKSAAKKSGKSTRVKKTASRRKAG